MSNCQPRRTTAILRQVQTTEASRHQAFWSPRFLLLTPEGRNLCLAPYLCISIPDIRFCISIILSCIFFISFAET